MWQKLIKFGIYNRNMPISTSFCHFLRVSASLCQFLRVSASFCEFLRVSASFCKFLRVFACFGELLRVSASFCMFMQVSVSLCRFLWVSESLSHSKVLKIVQCLKSKQSFFLENQIMTILNYINIQILRTQKWPIWQNLLFVIGQDCNFSHFWNQKSIKLKFWLQK